MLKKVAACLVLSWVTGLNGAMEAQAGEPGPGEVLHKDAGTEPLKSDYAAYESDALGDTYPGHPYSAMVSFGSHAAGMVSAEALHLEDPEGHENRDLVTVQRVLEL